MKYLKGSVACLVMALMGVLAISITDLGNDFNLTILQCVFISLVGCNICAAIEGNK